jgi:hypothetical protein
LKWKVKATTMTGTAVKSSNGEESLEKSGSIRGMVAVPLSSAYTAIPRLMSMNTTASRMERADVNLSESACWSKFVSVDDR